MSIMHCSLLSLGCVFGCAPAHDQDSLSALKALRIAQRRLRPEVRSKLMAVSSARSDITLAPKAWRFTFADPATSGNSRVVTVAAKASSEHPDTVEAFSSEKLDMPQAAYAISQNKLTVDSDTALVQAKTAAKMKGIGGAQYRLTQPRSGQEPLWTLSLYATENEKDPVVLIQVGAKSGGVKILN